MKHRTKNTLWICTWMIAGTYFAVATLGGSVAAAAMTLICGFIAGRELT